MRNEEENTSIYTPKTKGRKRKGLRLHARFVFQGEKVESLLQSNPAINSPNQSLEQGLRAHGLAVSNTLSKSDSIPDPCRPKTCRTSWGGGYCWSRISSCSRLGPRFQSKYPRRPNQILPSPKKENKPASVQAYPEMRKSHGPRTELGK